MQVGGTQVEGGTHASREGVHTSRGGVICTSYFGGDHTPYKPTYCLR